MDERNNQNMKLSWAEQVAQIVYNSCSQRYLGADVAFGVAVGAAFGIALGAAFGVAFGVAFGADFGAAFGAAFHVAAA